MNNLEAIVHLGAQQGAALRPRTCAADVNPAIPYFSLRKDAASAGGYRIAAFNFERHDNADRMPGFLGWLRNSILPQVEGDVSGFYNIELHDSYTHLDNGMDYGNCLVWSKHKHDHAPVLLPDLYHIADFGGSVKQVTDRLPWHAKSNKVGFFGTTTGQRDPALNARLKACHWRATTPGAEHCCDFFVTKVAQMQEADIVRTYGQADWARMKHPHVPAAKLHEYKFCLDVPGNTCSWDRVPAVLNSRSLLFKLRCTDMCFYYPLLRSGTHYVHVDEVQDVLKHRAYYLSNSRDQEQMLNNANRFVQEHLQAQHAQLYTVALLNACAYHRGR